MSTPRDPASRITIFTVRSRRRATIGSTRPADTGRGRAQVDGRHPDAINVDRCSAATRALRRDPGDATLVNLELRRSPRLGRHPGGALEERQCGLAGPRARVARCLLGLERLASTDQALGRPGAQPARRVRGRHPEAVHTPGVERQHTAGLRRVSQWDVYPGTAVHAVLEAVRAYRLPGRTCPEDLDWNAQWIDSGAELDPHLQRFGRADDGETACGAGSGRERIEPRASMAVATTTCRVRDQSV